MSVIEERATFSPCRRYRYALRRTIDTLEGRGIVAFVGLNPSTADEWTDDPTIRRCIGFARAWGFSDLRMVNLYAWRSTDPRALWSAVDPIGPDNDAILADVFGVADLVVAAWGAHAREDRVQAIAEQFDAVAFHALGVTKDGAPRHPLYMPASALPVFYDMGAPA